MSYSQINPAWGRMSREKEKEAERSRREAETARARNIKAETPGITWGEALRQATGEESAQAVARALLGEKK